jgi:hypothetical protein
VEGGGEFTYEDFGVYLPSIVDERNQPKYLIPYVPEGHTKASLGGKTTMGAIDSEGVDENIDDPDKLSPEEKARRERLKQALENGGFKVDRYDFTLQFIWVPRSPRQRVEIREKRLEKIAAEEAAAAAAQEAASPDANQ